MRNPFGGYTILEVMIFIAISGLLLVTAMVVVGNKQAHTEFITSANDVNTKMRQWVNQVANGFTANPSSADSLTQYNCTIVADRPKLEVVTTGDAERGTNPDCVFLGKAVLINTEDANDTIYAYTVLGRRTYQGAGGEQVLVDGLPAANPEAAISETPGHPEYINLTEEYHIPNGTIIKSVESTVPVGSSHMGGFFTSFSGTDATNGAQSMMAVQYPMTSNNEGPLDSTPLNCIQLADPCFTAGPLPNPPSPMGTWTLCLASTRNNETAKLIVTSAQGRGIATRLEFTPC